MGVAVFRIAEEIFPADFVCVPDARVVVRVDRDRFNDAPEIASRFIGPWLEFSAIFAPSLADAAAPKRCQWHALRCADEVVPPAFHGDAARFKRALRFELGKLLIFAQVLGHWDVVNNLDLSNAGVVVADDGSLRLATVDGGCALGAGFDGLSADETAVNHHAERAAGGGPECGSVGDEVKGKAHVTPFVGAIFDWQLPRQIVPDLFDVDDPDVYAGFRSGVSCLRAGLRREPQAFSTQLQSLLRLDRNSVVGLPTRDGGLRFLPGTWSRYTHASQAPAGGEPLNVTERTEIAETVWRRMRCIVEDADWIAGVPEGSRAATLQSIAQDRWRDYRRQTPPGDGDADICAARRVADGSG